MVVVVMGVAGSGKTTIGALLAKRLGWDFYDGDDFHPPANTEKMKRGIPLTDEDRASWLDSLRALIHARVQARRPLVLACSGLKAAYRERLRVDGRVKFVYLRGTYEQIEARLNARKDHFMKPNMLRSQFEILEEPADAVAVEISFSPAEIVETICKELSL